MWEMAESGHEHYCTGNMAERQKAADLFQTVSE